MTNRRELTNTPRNSAALTAVFEAPPVFTREAVSQHLGESVLHFLEVVRKVPPPKLENESQPCSWRGLGGLALEVCRRQTETQIVEADVLGGLEKRQRDVAGLLMSQRLTTEKMAEILGISPFTVKRHIEDIYARLGIHSREELLRLVPSAAANRKGASLSRLASLTVLQAECVGHMLGGEDYPAIANNIGVSKPALKDRLFKAYVRLGVNSKYEATKLGLALQAMAEESVAEFVGVHLHTFAKQEAQFRALAAKDPTIAWELENYGRLDTSDWRNEKRKSPFEKQFAEYTVLTPQQTTVLEHVANGLSNKEIAASLGLTARTVIYHRSQARPKLVLSSYMEFMRAAQDYQVAENFGFDSLTDIEKELLAIAAGTSDTKEIAKKLRLSFEATQKRVASILDKLGQLYLSEAVIVFRHVYDLQKQSGMLHDGVPPGVPGYLTFRQWQVAQYLPKGYTNKQIAAEIGTRENVPSIAWNLMVVFAKLGVKNRVQAGLLLHPSINEDIMVPEGAALSRLTSQQQEVLKMILEGMSREEIAKRLLITTVTVNTYVLDARSALKTTSTVETLLVYKRLAEIEKHQQLLAENPDDLRANLSPRQAEIFELIRIGMDNKAISEDLNVTVATVRAQISRVLKKLGVHNKTQAVLLLYPSQLESTITVPEGVNLSDFSQPQKEIMEMSAIGLSAKEIAFALGKKPKAINARLRRIYEKLGVSNRTAAVYAFAGLTAKPQNSKGKLEYDADIDVNKLNPIIRGILHKHRQAGKITSTPADSAEDMACKPVTELNNPGLLQLLYDRNYITEKEFETRTLNLYSLVVAFLFTIESTRSIVGNGDSATVRRIVKENVTKHIRAYA